MALKLYVGALLVFAVGNLMFFMLAPMKYHLSLRMLRKGLYTLLIGAVAIGTLFNELELTNWVILLTLTAIVIFMDLALLLTPSIMKIWSAEFQYSDYVENVISESEKINDMTMDRVGTMSEMIQKSSTYFASIPMAKNDIERQTEQLQKYLQRYSDDYGFSVQLWDIDKVNSLSFVGEVTNDRNEQVDQAFYQSIEAVVGKIEKMNTFYLDKHRESDIHSLYESEIVSLIKEEAMIVPVYIKERNLLVVLKKEQGNLLEVDAVHIANLIYLFYFNQ
jgi:hypothetical protein